MRTLLSLCLLLLLVVPHGGQTKLGGTAKVGGTIKAGATGGGGSTLNNDIVAFWKLGETAGNARIDDPGTNDATESAATVGSGTGKLGNAATFAETNYLLVADNVPLSITTSMTVAAWININSSLSVTSPGLVSKWDAGQRSYGMRYDLTGTRLNMLVSADGTAFSTAVANTFGAPSTGTWIFVVGYVDLENDLVGIQVNDGTADTVSFTGASIFNSTAGLQIGHWGTADNTFFGSIDAVGIWSRVLTPAERTELYNSGTGKEYPF